MGDAAVISEPPDRGTPVLISDRMSETQKAVVFIPGFLKASGVAS